MTSLTRGPHAPGVYWRRRLAVLGTLLLLVVAISRTFGGSGDPDAAATPVSGSTSPSTETTTSPSGAASTSPSTSPSMGPTTGLTAGPTATVTLTPGATPTTTATTPTSTPTLPAPTGRCSDDDIVVTPSVTDAQATKTVVVRLTLRTEVTTACTWRVSSRSVQLKITSGSDRIWSSLDCPKAIPDENVVVRRDSDAFVDVGWSSRRSDEDCSSHTDWAGLGYYHATVAALGGEPQDVQFRLVKPVAAPKATRSATPTATASASPTATASGARQEPQGDPTKATASERPVD